MADAETLRALPLALSACVMANAGVEYMVSASKRVRIPAYLINFSWDPLTDFVAITNGSSKQPWNARR